MGFFLFSCTDKSLQSFNQAFHESFYSTKILSLKDSSQNPVKSALNALFVQYKLNKLFVQKVLDALRNLQNILSLHCYPIKLPVTGASSFPNDFINSLLGIIPTHYVLIKEVSICSCMTYGIFL